MNNLNRRHFIRTSLLAGAAVSVASPLAAFATSARSVNTSQLKSGVGLTTGDNRADMVFRALLPYSRQIRQAIGNRRVVLKPNNVSIDIPL